MMLAIQFLEYDKELEEKGRKRKYKEIHDTPHGPETLSVEGLVDEAKGCAKGSSDENSST